MTKIVGKLWWRWDDYEPLRLVRFPIFGRPIIRWINGAMRELILLPLQARWMARYNTHPRP